MHNKLCGADYNPKESGGEECKLNAKPKWSIITIQTILQKIFEWKIKCIIPNFREKLLLLICGFAAYQDKAAQNQTNIKRRNIK